MPAHPVLTALLQKAHRRVLSHMVLDKAALALSIAMGGAILLLLVGTQILDWYWPALLALAGFGTGVYQLRGKIPSPYRVAQKIDRRLELADSLSTAFYFSANPDPQRAAICTRQQGDAETTAAQVDVKSALPYQRSRYLLPAGVLALAALALFAVRYGALGSLDLSQSLLAVAADSFFATPTEIAKNDAQKGNLQPQTFDPGSPDQAVNAEEELPESLLEPADNPSGLDPSGKDASKDASQKDKGDKGSEGDNPDEGNPGDDPNTDNPDKQDGKNSKPGDNSSMLDKLRDALSNLLNKNKTDSNKQSQSQKGKNDKSESEKGESQQGDANSAEPGQDQNKNAKEQGDAKGGEGTNQPPSQENASSQGDKIGDKTIKDAQALEAMGKISELLGKRSANLQGEVMVEVGQTKQQLKTQWTSKDARHADAGGEIHRNEVPLVYQPFVERYFEELRKTPEGGARAPKAPKAAAAGKSR